MGTLAVLLSTSSMLLAASTGMRLIGSSRVITMEGVITVAADISATATITGLVCTMGVGVTKGSGSSGPTMPMRKKTTAAAATAARRPVSTSKIAVRFCFNYELLAITSSFVTLDYGSICRVYTPSPTFQPVGHPEPGGGGSETLWLRINPYTAELFGLGRAGQPGN